MPTTLKGAMSFAIVAALIGLAVLDSSSLSTLLVPLWLLARPGEFEPRRLVTYVTVTAVTYLGLGLLVLTLAHQLIDAYVATLRGPLADRIVIVLGAVVVLMGIISVLRGRREARPGPSAAGRLRDKALASNTSTATLALSAIALEAATMWPYLLGISLIAANGPGLPMDVLWLVLYNVVMILPAAILTWARARFPDQTDLLLSKTRETMTAGGSHFTAWLAILIGVWIIIARLI